MPSHEDVSKVVVCSAREPLVVVVVSVTKPEVVSERLVSKITHKALSTVCLLNLTVLNFTFLNFYIFKWQKERFFVDSFEIII